MSSSVAVKSMTDREDGLSDELQAALQCDEEWTLLAVVFPLLAVAVSVLHVGSCTPASGTSTGDRGDGEQPTAFAVVHKTLLAL